MKIAQDEYRCLKSAEEEEELEMKDCEQKLRKIAAEFDLKRMLKVPTVEVELAAAVAMESLQRVTAKTEKTKDRIAQKQRQLVRLRQKHRRNKEAMFLASKEKARGIVETTSLCEDNISFSCGK